MKTMYSMKSLLLAVLFTFAVSPLSVFAQNDTLTSGKFTDTRDDNDYNWVKIGKQVWMAENLAYLPSVNLVDNGSEDEEGSYYYVYGYDGTNVTDAKATSNYDTYGVLYNWTAAQGACPTGWHLPSDVEWTELIDYLGGKDVAGGKLKESGTTHWKSPKSPNTEVTNETGFTALPGGHRYGGNGDFDAIRTNGYWWSATSSYNLFAWSRYMAYKHSDVIKIYYNKEWGLSVRCVRD